MKKILKSHGVRGLYKSSYLQFMRDFIGCGMTLRNTCLLLAGWLLTD